MNKKQTLKAVVELGAAGGLVKATSELGELVHENLVLVSGEPDADGNIMAVAAEFQQAAPAKVEAPAFAIESGIAVPAITREGAGRKAKYPYDQLEKGQSFFVPNSAVKGKDSFKSLASVNAQNNAKYSEEIPGQTRINRNGVEVPATRPIRKFAVRRWTEKDGTEGARVFRLM